MPLRLVLMGTGDFALPTFRRLIESEHQVAAVFTQPEKSGRGHHRHVNPVRVLAQEHRIPVRQPTNLSHDEELAALRGFNADVFIVASYGHIMRPEVLLIPHIGAFNLHGSLLPRHRGASPVQYTIWKGDEVGGVTIFRIEPALDSGPILCKAETPITADDTSETLMKRLAELSPDLTIRALEMLESRTARFEHQDESLVTMAPKIQREQGIIDWTQSAAQIDCHIRAMIPWPKASTVIPFRDGDNLRVILHKAKPVDGYRFTLPGTIVNADRRLTVQTADGALDILELQAEGGKVMPAVDFLNGRQIPTGTVLTRG